MQLKRCSSPLGSSLHSNPAGAGGQPTLPTVSYRDRPCQDRPRCAGRATLEWQLLVDQGPGQLDPGPNRGYLSPRRCQHTLDKSSFKLMQSNASSFSVKYANVLVRISWNSWINLHADFYGIWSTILSIIKIVMCWWKLHQTWKKLHTYIQLLSYTEDLDIEDYDGGMDEKCADR